MMAAGGLDDGTASGRVDVSSVADELLGLDERLRGLIFLFDEAPSAIDNELLNAGRLAVGVEAVLTQVYRAMKDKVFSEKSPVRVDADLWEALREQRDEFVGFYRSALNAVELHKELHQHFTLVKNQTQSRLQHGDLSAVRQDKQAYLEERDECITAISNFYGKFSAMLAELRS